MTDTADAQAPPENEVAFTLNGKELTARKGELVIAAAERHGVYIPHFCYHPRMQPVGMCRMCIVEIDTGRGPALQPSCMLEVTPDMKVDTRSPLTTKAQDGVLEFLLINHPLDCPVCDKGGECPLQDQTLAYGPGESRFVEEKRHYEKPIPISDLVVLDRERCILCDRCTRFAKDVAGDPLIHFLDRGGSTQVNTFPDHPFASYFSGNTVQICPVGALTASSYRFKARPWDLEETESTCTSCAVGCRVTVQTSRDRILRLTGVDSDPVNWGWLCDKGRFGFEALNHEDRLGTPVVRQGDHLAEVSWAHALAGAADAIRNALAAKGPSGIGFIGGARATNEAAYAWAKLAKGVVRTDNVDCQLGDGLPAELVLGAPRATLDGLCTPGGTIVVLGCDPKEELPVLFLRLRHAVVEDKVKLLEINARSSAVTPLAAASIFPRAGEMGRVAQHIAGAADGSDVGGVGGRELAEVAALLATATGPIRVLVGRQSVAESHGPTVDAVAALLAGLGPDRVQVLPALRRANVAGALDMGLAPGMLPGRVTLDEGRAAYEGSWPGVPAERGKDTVEMLQAAAAGEIDVLVLLGADVFDVPDRDLARRALSSTTVIAVDLFETDSTGLADIVLPAAAFGETAGTTTNFEGRVTAVTQRASAPGTARADWMIAAELAWRLDADLALESPAQIWDEIERLAPSHRGVTSIVLRSPRAADGVVVPVADPEVFLADISSSVTIVSSGVHGRTGVDAVESLPAGEDAAEPAADEPAADGATPDAATPDDDTPSGPASPPLVTFVAPEVTTEPEPLDAYSLRLIATRKLYDQGTLVQHALSLAPLEPGTRVAINSYDIDRLGVDDDEQVKVSSAKTSFLCEVVRDEGVPRGCAAMVFNQANVTVGELIDAAAVVNDVRVETVRGTD